MPRTGRACRAGRAHRTGGPVGATGQQGPARAARDAAGPAGAGGAGRAQRAPPGATGAAGAEGRPREAASRKLDDLAGLPCGPAAAGGHVEIAYDAAGHVALTCVGSGGGGGGGGTVSVHVNELQTGTTGSASDEFVELHNAGTGAAATSAAGRSSIAPQPGTSDTTLATIPTGTTIPAGGFYLLGGSAYAGSHTPNQSFTASIAATGGAVGVRDASGTLVDGAGWGTATNAFVEGTAATAPPTTAPPGSAIERVPDGHDTNDNSADFSVTSSPTPGTSNG